MSANVRILTTRAPESTAHCLETQTGRVLHTIQSIIEDFARSIVQPPFGICRLIICFCRRLIRLDHLARHCLFCISLGGNASARAARLASTSTPCLLAVRRLLDSPQALFAALPLLASHTCSENTPHLHTAHPPFLQGVIRPLQPGTNSQHMLTHTRAVHKSRGLRALQQRSCLPMSAQNHHTVILHHENAWVQ